MWGVIMRKKIGIIMAVILLFTSCGNIQNQPDKKKVITVCVDYLYEPAVSELVNIWKKLRQDVDVKLVIIPKEEAEIKISELRTEIMSGGGPDVFILEGMPLLTEDIKNVLFLNPQKMMDSEVFLPLDHLIEQAQYMNPDIWNQKILESGRTEEGQLILPICYEYYAYAFRTDDLDDSQHIPSSWEELLVCEEKPIIKETVSKVLMSYYSIFGELADYQNEILFLSEEEFTKRIQEVILLREKYWNMEGREEIPEAMAAGRVDSDFFSALEREKGEHTIFAFPNIDGGITATVNLYAAINRNTNQQEEAFSLLDLLFSEEIMCGKGVSVEGHIQGSNIMLQMISNRGIPIHNDALRQLCGKISEEDKTIVMGMGQQIQTVCYASDFIRELADMYWECTAVREEDKRREIISQTYYTLQMNLAE